MKVKQSKIYQRSSYREHKTDFRLPSLVQVKYIVLRFWSLLHNCFTDPLCWELTPQDSQGGILLQIHYEAKIVDVLCDRELSVIFKYKHSAFLYITAQQWRGVHYNPWNNNYLSVNTRQYYKKLQSSATLLWKPQFF